ncbi:hypothetical protein DTO212C5_555 [Paecilomyces variotii]|nr:hypothetical protein DTO212C5_555 [Paecilomyces variotii]
MAKTLKEQLEDARVECSYDRRQKFIPRDSLKRLITRETVRVILQNEGLDQHKADDIAECTSKQARGLFAILVSLKKPREIEAFLEERICDRNIPFWRPPNDSDYRLHVKREDAHEPVQCMSGWQRRQREKFDEKQQWISAHFFEYQGSDNLEDRIVPFVKLLDDDKNHEVKEGAYSKVFACRIHHAHHDLPLKRDRKGNIPLVAIKKLKSLDEGEFKKEHEALRRIATHSHLIKLLASFRHRDEWHFVFQYADFNLRTFWEQRPRPPFDERTIRWTLKQMIGIADGLVHIHGFRPTFSQPVSLVNRDANMQVISEIKLDEEEKIFGRHGDIKPENILFFQLMDGIDDPDGVLQIADFGLGRFHGRDSRSNIDPTGVVFSPTYEPPECKIFRPVSRVYDIWSLGCLYLEFITWLLKGYAEIENFAEHRSEISALGISEDNFFTVLPSGDDAEVRRGVRTWVEELRTLPQCSQLIHDLLHLIIDDMIVIKAEDRIRSMELRRRLSQMQDKANGCKDYLLKGCPRPRSTYRLLSSSVNTRAERRAPSHLRRDVRFAERVKTA